jgi:hypothetical protein
VKTNDSRQPIWVTPYKAIGRFTQITLYEREKEMRVNISNAGTPGTM